MRRRQPAYVAHAFGRPAPKPKKLALPKPITHRWEHNIRKGVCKRCGALYRMTPSKHNRARGYTTEYSTDGGATWVAEKAGVKVPPCPGVLS